MANNKDFISLSTGGLGNRQHDDRKKVEMEAVHPKTDVPNPGGLAKASPNFKDVKPKVTPTKADLKKTLAENTKIVKEEKEEEKDKLGE